MMRIWSLHPKHLDTKGLVALWRETLLAQKVLLGQTKGYINHPQLNRFKATSKPISAISTYLFNVFLEAEKRGYNFDVSKIYGSKEWQEKIVVNSGQVDYELRLLKSKLAARDPVSLHRLGKEKITVHPIFKKSRSKKIEEWEVIREDLL